MKISATCLEMSDIDQETRRCGFLCLTLKKLSVTIRDTEPFILFITFSKITFNYARTKFVLSPLNI